MNLENYWRPRVRLAKQGEHNRTVTPITLEQAKALSHRTTLYHITHRNTDGTAVRARVNGKPRTWKRDTQRVEIPMKYGLRECFYITHHSLDQWSLDDPTRPQEAPHATEKE